MSKLSMKLEWAILGSVGFIFVYPDAETRVVLSVLSVLIGLVAEVVRAAAKRFLAPAFQFPLLLVVVLTLFEAAKLIYANLHSIPVSFAFISVALILHSSKRMGDRIETAFLFLIFVLLVVMFQTSGISTFDTFYPMNLVVIAFGSMLFRYGHAFARRGRR